MAIVAGITLNPLGEPTAMQIRITCLDGAGNVLTTARASVSSDEAGNYSFDLQQGDYSIEVYSDLQWNEIGRVRVDEATPGVTLMELIENYAIPEA